jgi:hypothetical protein
VYEETKRFRERGRRMVTLMDKDKKFEIEGMI